MNKPSQEDLLGYVLGAMDAQEARNIQAAVDEHPQWEDELLEMKNSMLPLDHLDSGGPRPGLARRTVELMAALERDGTIPAITPAQATERTAEQSSATDGNAKNNTKSAEVSADTHPASLPPIRSVVAGHWSSAWSLPNTLVTVAALAVMAGLMFPALSYSRHQARLASCQNNLQTLGRAFLKYSDLNQGRFVAIPATGKLAASGCFGPMLKDHGLLEDDSVLACAGVADETPVHIPTVEQLVAANDDQLAYLQETMGGHFGYSMGYRENGTYQSPRNLGRTNVVLLADTPSNALPGRRSNNHGGRGQNCLFEDGRVQFVSGHAIGGDAIFENDYGIVAPGSHSRDSVIAPSHLSPRGASIEFISN